METHGSLDEIKKTAKVLKYKMINLGYSYTEVVEMSIMFNVMWMALYDGHQEFIHTCLSVFVGQP